MPPRKKKPRTRTTGSTSSSRSRPFYNPSKHSLASLPYHVLLTILTHAATAPGAVHDWPDPSFLLSCSTICRTLHDPAMAVLYRNPPTHPPARAHKLLHALRERPELGRMVKRLVVEIDPLLVTKVGGAAWDVCEFVLLARGLRDLQFAHVVDNPPYHEEPGMRLGWRYPDALWNALGGKAPAENGKVKPEEGVKLKAWKWNGRFIGKLSFADIGQIHQQRSFSALTSLSLIYMDTLDSDDGVGDGSVEGHIADLASSLTDLCDVKFECCSIANRKLLSLLSVSASHLKFRELRFINCPLLQASDSEHDQEAGLGLTSFLEKPFCRTLQVLEVLSCRSCPLTFIAALSSTPTLEHLSFDAHLFNSTLLSRTGNTDLNYSTLLPLSDSALIAWPPSLQSLSATSLRKWTSDERASFLSSLVDAAPSLHRLKRVEIWCILTDIDWRERAVFRKTWCDVVDTAFSGAEKVEVRFDNARPAEQQWKEGDFLPERSVFTRSRPKKATRGAITTTRSATRGKTTKRKRVTRAGAGSSVKNLVIVQGSDSEGDEEYTEGDEESDD